MNHRTLAATLVAVLPGIAAPLAAQSTKVPQSPAEFFPAHTYLYAQCNPFSSVAGVKGLKLARLLEDEMIGELFAAALEQIPRDQDPRAMLQKYPLDKALGDRLALGVVGFRARKGDFGEADQRSYRFPEDGAVPADLFDGKVDFQGEVLVAAKVEDEALFTKTLVQLLTDMVLDGEPPKITLKSTDGMSYQEWSIPDVGELYSTMIDGYCLVAQSDVALYEAVQRREARSASLASRNDFRNFRVRRGGKETAGFLHVGLDSAIELFSPMIPARDRREMEMWGAFDYAGLQAGMGFHEGGVCEWLQLAFAKDPKGIFMNLARLMPATGFAETETHRGTVYSASLTFDWAAFYKSTKFLLELCDVDLKDFERDARQELGMDLQEDLLAALGNTVGAVGVMPKLGLIPEMSLVFKIRDRAKVEKILAHLLDEADRANIPTKRFTVPGGGPKAVYFNLGKDIPIKPAFAVSGDKLVVSPMPLMLKYAIRKSRRTGHAIIDFVPDPTRIAAKPMFSYAYDPAPMAENVYADLLKLLDASDSRGPIDPTDLPSPEFVATCLSKLGIGFSIDPYSMSLELHSPTGLAVPTLLGTAAAMQMQKGKSIH